MAKTVTLKDGNISAILFDDAETIVMEEARICVGDPWFNIIYDCNSVNSVLHSNVTAPQDWFPQKYLFDGSNWALNPDFEAPAE